MIYIIPSLLFIGISRIIYKMVRENKLRKRAKSIKASKEAESRMINERIMMRDILFCEQWWLNGGRFNRTKYIEFLEAKQHLNK